MPEQFNKRDLETILEVNKKAVEIETLVADQNEEIIKLLENAENRQIRIENQINALIKGSDDLSKDVFKIRVLFITGVLGIVAEVIHIFFLAK